MNKVVFDSNVLVSAAVSSGACSELMEEAERKAFLLYVSEEILKEVADTLADPEIGMSSRKIRIYIRKIRKRANVIKKPMTVKVVRSDEDDDKIIGCALAAKADYIVTGDHHLLDLERYKGIRIVRVREFMDISKGQRDS